MAVWLGYQEVSCTKAASAGMFRRVIASGCTSRAHCMHQGHWGRDFGHNTNHRANGEATAHSNQAFGAFWSRVTPPELLYIWLLSFDELRLAMNAHLPVVRPLLCYARRGATPMHQKKRDSGLQNRDGHPAFWVFNQSL